MPAMIAIAIHTAGALGKLFSEVAEAADLRPVEGLASTGAAWAQRMALAVMPQVAPNWLSYALPRFEINIRASAILGFVGAGGIGYELRNAMTFGQGRFDQAAISLAVRDHRGGGPGGEPDAPAPGRGGGAVTAAPHRRCLTRRRSRCAPSRAGGAWLWRCRSCSWPTSPTCSSRLKPQRRRLALVGRAGEERQHLAGGRTTGRAQVGLKPNAPAQGVVGGPGGHKAPRPAPADHQPLGREPRQRVAHRVPVQRKAAGEGGLGRQPVPRAKAPAREIVAQRVRDAGAQAASFGHHSSVIDLLHSGRLPFTALSSRRARASPGRAS